MIYMLLIATFIWATTAVAQVPNVSDPQIPLIALPALATCGDWHAERRGEGQYRWQAEVSWFQGFIAGHNYYVPPPANKMITAEPNDVALWLDSYCVKNPTHNLARAAADYAAAYGGRNFRPDVPNSKQK